jgi:hypothetical protein
LERGHPRPACLSPQKNLAGRGCPRSNFFRFILPISFFAEFSILRREKFQNCRGSIFLEIPQISQSKENNESERHGIFFAPAIPQGEMVQLLRARSKVIYL